MADWIDLVDKKKLIRNILQILDKHINASVDYPAELFEIKRELLESIDIELSFFEQDSVNRWIPCSERLPKQSGFYLAYFTFKDGTHATDIAYINTGCHLGSITRWMPLPEPPKGGPDDAEH